MNIALIGATGNIGTEIAREARRRGHAVTAVVRNVEKVPVERGTTARQGDLGDPGGLADVLWGHDAVAVAVPFRTFDIHAAIDVTKAAGVPRLAMVGGAGSLRGADGNAILDSPDFPEAYRPEASAAAAALDVLRAETALDWTFLSPSAVIAPGERTGRFRLGGDALLVGEDGQSRVSQADYAIAFVDELERPAHSRRRFTVGY